MAKCDCLSASKLIHSAAIYTESKVADGIGGFTRAWVLLDTVKCRFTPKRGKEVLLQERIKNPITHEVIMRYRDDFNHNAKLVYDGREFNIKSVIDINERKRWLSIDALENVNIGE